MNNNFNKGKDLSPESTIENIKNFFSLKNYNLKIKKYSTKYNTYYCHIDLFYQNQFILSSNGKGTNESYCLASGLAELYERYCSLIVPFSKYLVYYDMILYNKLNKNYFLSKDEKFLSLTEILEEPNIKYFYEKYLSNYNNIYHYFNIKYDNIFIGLPYKNIINDKIKYYDPRILYTLYGSNGLAAGNTFEEAFIQGLSEIFERYIMSEFFYNEQEIYYNIDFNILDLNLQNIIKSIEEENKKIYILDLSYNFNLPVCLVIVCDKNNFSISYNFGSSPNFNIAVERCLTELYQGFIQEDYDNKIQLPFKNTDISSVCIDCFHHSQTCEYINENIFKKIIIKNEYNKKYFYEENTNIYYLNKYKNILKNNNIQCYYKDFSQDPNIKTLHIYTDLNLNYIYNKCNYNFNNCELSNFLNKSEKIFNILKNILNNQNNLNDNNISILDEKELILFNILFPGDNLNLYNNNEKTYNNLIEILLNYYNLDLKYLLSNIKDIKIKNNYKKYLTLLQYIQSKKYSDQEILEIFNNIFNIKISKEELKYFLNKNYILFKICFEPLLLNYNNIFYVNYIKNLCTNLSF